MPLTRKNSVLLAVALVGFVVAGILISGQLRAEPGSAPDATNSEYRSALLDEYDLSTPLIEIENLMAPGRIGRDGIPAITDPKRVPAATAEYPPDDARVIEVTIGEHSVAYPLLILNWHEIINDTVGGVPIAATYCPLCDSVSVFDRRLGDGVRKPVTIEFGVSGLLYNSNVVMYEHSTMGLWSQVFMKAVTGPHSGQSLDHLPFRVVTFADFKRDHPNALVLSADTGHQRDYDHNPYADYFADPADHPLFGQFPHDDRLPPKTLGIGIRAGTTVVFVTAEAAREKPITIDTDKGPVTVTAGDAGIQVTQLPDGADALQTFYHSWSGFHPKTAIIPEPEPAAD